MEMSPLSASSITSKEREAIVSLTMFIARQNAGRLMVVFSVIFWPDALFVPDREVSHSSGLAREVCGDSGDCRTTKREIKRSKIVFEAMFIAYVFKNIGA